MTRILVVLLFFIILIGSCKKNSEKPYDQHYIVLIDSLDNWIEMAKNPVTSRDVSLPKLLKISQIIDTISIDSLRVKYLSELSLAYYTVRDSINFLNTNKELEVFAIKIKDSTKLAEAYWDKGEYFNWGSVRKRDSAYYYLSKAQKLFDLRGENLQSARLLRSMASIQTAVHDNTGALVTMTESLKLLKPLKNNKRLYEAYNTMGIAAAALEEYDEAFEYYNLADQYLNKTKPANTDLVTIYNNIGLLYYKKGDFANAKIEYEKALNIDSLYLLRPITYARVLDHLAMTNLKLGETTSVENDLTRALYIRDSIGDLEGLSLNYYNLSLFMKESGNTTDAFIYAQNSRDLSKQIDNNLRYMESLNLLAELDPGNAISYNKEYIRISDSLQQEERQIRNKFNRIRFETDETLAKNQQLSKQRLVWIGVATGVVLLAMALFIIVIQRIKNQRLKFQQQQQEANQEIFNLMLAQKQKVEEGKQSEQKRISEELHDGVLGEMNGVRMILLGLNKKADDAAVALREQAIEKLKDVQEEIRSISHELNDTSYQKLNNFMSSVEELLKTICEPAGIKYDFTFDQDLDWDNLEGITKINLYRILQESLQNCVKHAAATTVYISFETNEKDMLISIQDNGRGFDTSKGKAGIGHKNIKSRIEKIKGRWHLRSAPGIGTTVLLEIPLEHISQDTKKEISLPMDLQKV
ncbi:tetratricopeptide repeat protein [uncultured Muriicola sp.]|uniref:tetratricopeptide repeat-containing sensor histidine kinase n=1 Tax=uncultured Muriicola sp. TaxID=1583102 RepID=UPI0026281ED6|nr:tetratricopeptide repeat protein [uncultured Muriicola sp.]